MSILKKRFWQASSGNAEIVEIEKVSEAGRKLIWYKRF